MVWRTAWLCWGEFLKRHKWEIKAFMSLQMVSVGACEGRVKYAEEGFFFLIMCGYDLNKMTMCVFEGHMCWTTDLRSHRFL